MAVNVTTQGSVYTVSIDRPERRNAVDGATASALADAFRRFERDDACKVAVLCGEGGHFCAGADLQALSQGVGANSLQAGGDGPMGPTRMLLNKPVIAAVSGYAVAGGLELALWCDLRVVEEDATFGVYCRRFGVPLVDGGTVRLPRLIGMSRALDMILTGRAVKADEALQIGLANRVVPSGSARSAAEELAAEIAAFPQQCMRGDRLSAYQQWDRPISAAIDNEFQHGLRAVERGETLAGATAFSEGVGRHGLFE
ncbi:MAG: crotonase/enoyl-CoA hydratase family protein [Pseudomonadales bacterium]